MRTIGLTFTLLALLMAAGCGVSGVPLDEPVAAKVANVEPTPTPTPTTTLGGAVTPWKIKTLTTAKKEDMLGCWSSGTAMILKITKDQVFLSSKFIPTNYVEESWADGVLVIRLIDRREFYLFQEFVSLQLNTGLDEEHLKKFGPMLITYSAETLDDLKSLRLNGREGWTRSDCEQVFPQTKPRRRR